MMDGPTDGRNNGRTDGHGLVLETLACLKKPVSEKGIKKA